jgi:hypothetical protein
MQAPRNLSYSTGIGRSDELALQWRKALDLSAYSGIDDYFCPLGPRAACSFWWQTRYDVHGRNKFILIVENGGTSKTFALKNFL